MNNVDRIPIPAATRWREFRVRWLPFLVLLTTIAGTSRLWRGALPLCSVQGQIEADDVAVTCPKAGILTNLHLSRLQSVRQGDALGYVITTNPAVAAASLGVIQAEIRLLRVNMGPLLPQERLALTHDRLRLDWLEQRVQLASARTRLQLAESELRRSDQLFRDKVLSEEAREQAQTTRDRLTVEVEERSKLIAELEYSSARPHPPGSTSAGPNTMNDSSTLEAAIEIQEQKLRLAEAEMSPLTLRAPIDGIVSKVHRCSGEAIRAGESIVTLAAANSDRIIAYLPQPLRIHPKVGNAVEVRVRSQPPTVALAKILAIGSRMETIPAPLRLPGSNGAAELGLPITVNQPCDLHALPGEVVDLKLLP